MKALLALAVAFSVSLAFFFAAAAEANWKAGVATVKITPEVPVPMAGYASRTSHSRKSSRTFTRRRWPWRTDKASAPFW